VLHLYEEEGDSFVERLNGMFALAIWDRRRDRLVCARDRYGIKPFYYHAGPSWFLFGSEIKALLASGLMPRELNAEALPEYFTFQNTLSDQTLFEGVRILRPGHVLTLELDGRSRPSSRRYWAFDFSRARPAEETNEQQCARELAGLLEDAVRRQLVADVEVGSYLSGGMDSGSLVAFASRAIPRLYTFTNGFDLSSVTGIESGFDERARAERLASRFQTEHYEMVIHAGDMAACLPKLVWHLEDLRVGNCYQNYYAAKLAGRFVKVCLSGAGGDELLGGYPWRYQVAASAGSVAGFDDHYYRYWERLIGDEAKPRFFTHEVWDRLKRREGRGYFDELMADAPRVAEPANVSSHVTRALWFELNTFLPGILCVEDRVSMSHSLEVRVPFLDNDLVDFALTVPNEFKIGGLGLETAAGKQILRRAMAGVLPPETLAEKKQGFSPPDSNWYRGPNLNYIEEILLDGRTLSRGWFEPRELQRVMEEHSTGRANRRLLIWSLLCLEWLQRVLLDPSREDLATSGIKVRAEGTAWA
jgi:asparagine synthase (glutamine-hydrolysing)